MPKLKPVDFVILLLILFCGVFCIFSAAKTQSQLVHVQAGKNSYVFNLKKDGVYSVNGEIGKTVIQIQNGKVRITDSCCPNKTCVAQGWGSLIICLPNKVYVSVDNQGDFDGISE